MGSLRHTTNELLVGLFNYILYIEERNLKKRGIKLSMNDVHILESIQKASDNSMSHIAARIMVTQGTLTTNVNKLIAKGYVERYQDEKDKRIKRLRITEKALPLSLIHICGRYRLRRTSLQHCDLLLAGRERQSGDR